MSKAQKNDPLTDELAMLYAKKDNDPYLDFEDLPPEIYQPKPATPELAEKVARELKKQKRRLPKKHPIRRVLLIAAILLTLITVPVVAINWEKIAAFFVQSWDTHTTVGNSPLASEELPPENWDALYMPSWLPAGFYPEATNIHTSYIEVLFGSNDSKIHFILLQGGSDFQMELDTEFADAEPIQMNGLTGIIVEQDGIVKLAWGAAPQFLLSGPLPQEDMIRIAESVQPPAENKS